MRRLFLFVSILIIAWTFSAHADEPNTITLSAPETVYAEACATPLWHNITMIWDGVTDARDDAAVGVQRKKNSEPVRVMAAPSVAESYNAALQKLLTACGMTLSRTANAELPHLRVEVREFGVTATKKFVSSEGKARSELTFITSGEFTSPTSVTVSYELDEKGLRQSKLKQLEKLLQKLFSDSLREIARTKELKQLK